MFKQSRRDGIIIESRLPFIRTPKGCHSFESCHPFGIYFIIRLVATILTSLRDYFANFFNSASPMIFTPNDFALSNFDPGLSPSTK